MGKNLVIVESPAKAKKIGQFLGKDYVVMASVGHVRDLPAHRLGVDIEHGFDPEYVATDRGKKVLKELKTEVKKCEKVFLAPDPDREGEAIAWHLFEALKDQMSEDDFYRVTYNEITKPAIQSAFKRPEKINMDRVNAQQARRVLDRLVGFQGSPVVRKQIRGAQSVGRVQTVALRLVVERENEILNFKPEKYFAIGAEVRKQQAPLDPFIIRLARINGEPVGVKDRKLLPGAVKTQAQLENIQRELDKSSLKVSDVFTKEVVRSARPPFITSTMQQSASGSLGYTPARTMGVAQKLYEDGLITYMRTDSFNVAKSAQEECRLFIANSYGAEYLPEKPNFYKSRGAAQEAHEAIRPTNVSVLPGKEGMQLEPAEKKLYKLIWERFVASQMVPAKIARRTVEVEAGVDNTYLFRATASEILFPGYMKASGIEAAADGKNGSGEEDEADKLPPLEQGEPLDVLQWLAEQKETKPVARYTEASLIRALEENGVGRPSTYAAIMSKLDEREYVRKEKRSLIPTELGMELVDLVLKTEEKHKPDKKADLFEVRFTADMETRLDKVEEGKIEWTQMMQEFYPSLLEWIDHAKETADPEQVDKYLEALKHVITWADPCKSGRRTYDDRKTFEDLKTTVGQGELLSKRQGEMLHKMCCRYIHQIPAALVRELELVEPEAVRDHTPRKLDLLSHVKFEEPHKVGKRTYDDKKFCRSLGEQIVMGKRLSERQLAALDSMLIKYSEQIPDFDSIRDEFHLGENGKATKVDSSTEPILEMMTAIKEWAEPTQRGKREYNDKTFYESLATQFKSKGALSDRQVAALKKMAARYADQISNYAAMQDKYGLYAPRKAKEQHEKVAHE